MKTNEEKFMCDKEKKRYAMRLGKAGIANTASDQGWRGGGQNDKNCALCSAVGAVNLCANNDFIWSSGMMAKSIGSSDTREGAGNSLDQQILTIKQIVSEATGRINLQYGTMNNEEKYNDAINFMLTRPDNTVFALSCSGEILGDPKHVRRCHWLNAIKQNGKILYYDYQVMKVSKVALPGKDQPATSQVPFIGIIPQLSYTSESGEFDTNTLCMVVLAFLP